MSVSSDLNKVLKELKEKRKQGQLTAREFYLELLKLVIDLVHQLQVENITDQQVKKQIPLILAFLESQISEMERREAQR